ncbi:hypothetical protein [Candidatus Nitrospira salsa]
MKLLTFLLSFLLILSHLGCSKESDAPFNKRFDENIKHLSEELSKYKLAVDRKIKLERRYLEANEKKYGDDLTEAYAKMLDQKNVLLASARKVGFNHRKFRANRAKLQAKSKSDFNSITDFSNWSLEFALGKLIDFYHANPKAYHAGLQSKRNDGYFSFIDADISRADQQSLPAHTEIKKSGSNKSLAFPTNDRAPFGIFMNRTFTKNDVFYLAYNSLGLEGNCLGNSHRKVICDLPYLALSMESNYEPLDGRRLMELNFDFISEDNSYSNRYLSFEIDNDTYFTRWGLAGNDIRIEKEMNSQNFIFQPNGNSRFFFKNKIDKTEVVQLGGGDDHHPLSAIEIGPSALTGSELKIKNKKNLSENQTALDVYIHGIGYRDINVGKPDSCGNGYRCLKIAN